MNNILNWIKERKSALLRASVLGLALVNVVLQMFGKNVIQISDEQLTSFLSSAWLVVSAIWAYWKDNPITKTALDVEDYKETLKQDITDEELDIDILDDEEKALLEKEETIVE